MSLLYLICVVLASSQFTHSLECNILGQCYNSTLLSVVANSGNFKHCHTKCKTMPNCKWLTYDPAAEFCFLFSDCSSIVQDEDDCLDCVTSEVDCPLLDCDDNLIGLCLGSFVHYSHEETKDTCIQHCKNSQDCDWYSYNSQDKICLQFNACPTINDKFEDYVSGTTKTCNQRLLVATGIDTSAEDYFLSSSEIIDLSDSQVCPDFGTYPMKIAGGTGGLLNGKYPVICGGETQYSVSIDDCYVLGNPALTSKLPTEKYLASSLMINDSHLWLTGGSMRDASGLIAIHDTSEYVSLHEDKLTVTSGPTLPVPINGHCMVQTTIGIMLIGGVTPDTILDKTFIYSNQTWTVGPRLNFRRRDHACGVININGRNHIIVSGGFVNDESRGSTTIESLDVTRLAKGWQHGLLEDPYFGLPRGLIGHTLVKLPAQSLILVGGAYVEDYFHFESSEEILKLDFSNDGKPTWVLLNRLSGHGRYSTVAMLLPDEEISCH